MAWHCMYVQCVNLPLNKPQIACLYVPDFRLQVALGELGGVLRRDLAGEGVLIVARPSAALPVGSDDGRRGRRRFKLGRACAVCAYQENLSTTSTLYGS